MLGKSGLYLITDEREVGYLTGYRSADGFVVFDEEDKLFFIDSRYYYAVKKQLGYKWDVRLGSKKEALEYIQKTGKRLFVDYRYTTLAFNENLKALGIDTEDCSKEIESMMIIKSPAEIKKIKKACGVAERAFKNTLKVLKVGMTESQVAAYLENQFRVLGASGVSFETIVAFGSGSAVPHYQTGKKELQPETVVLMDFGCVVDGYCSDMTRTFYFGLKPDKEFLNVYNAVLTAHLKTFEKARAGMAWADVDKIARDSLTDAGYGKFFTHSLGHGVGVNIHEAPSLSPKGQGTLENGMVHSIEPGVYLNGKFGVRIEDTDYIENGVCKSFMTFTKKLVKIKPQY